MPLDVRLLRSAARGGDVEAVRETLRRRMMDASLADEGVALDERWRALQQELEEARTGRTAHRAG